MKPLTKSDKARFNKICEEVRKYLHIEHWRYLYEFAKNDHEEGRTAEAGIYKHNSRIDLTFFPVFFEQDANSQLRTIIHEHIHCVLMRYDHLLNGIIKLLGDSESKAYWKLADITSEHVTDHLESVLYDLLKDKLLK